MAALLLAPLAAHAGSYVGIYTDFATHAPSQYSQGTHYSATGPRSQDGHIPFGDQPDSLYTNNANQQVYGGGSETVPNDGTKADCSGSLQTAWKWVPAQNMDMTTDPPPTQVIIMQTCTASVTVEQPSEIGNYRTGLGQSGTVSFNPRVLTGSATDTKYFVKPGGANVSLDALDAQANVTNAPAGASVGYTATISPVFVTLTGQNSANQALTGQQIMATLNGIPSSVKVTSYTWSFSGGTKGNPIKNWDGNGVAVDGTTPQQLFPLLNTELSQTDMTGNGISVSSISFYDQAADTITAKCAISVTFPDGTTGSINASSIPVTFMKPTANWTVSSTAPFGPQFDPSATGSMSFAVLWDATVTVPSPFSGGSGCFAQIVQPTIQFQRHPLNNQPVNCYLQEPRTNADGTTSYALPTTGLDTHFPYQASSTQMYPGGYIWDVSTKGEAGDQPGVGFAIVASDSGGNNWYTAFASGSFTTWLMYRPPASATGPGGTIWVPLQRADWSWTGNVVKNTATGMWNSASNGSAAVTGSSSNTGLVTDTPPQWSVINAGTAALRP